MIVRSLPPTARALLFPVAAFALMVLFPLENALHGQLKWETTTIEERLALGKADSEAVFRFENTGNYPVIIRSTNSSCGCTTAALARTTYYPGDKGEIVAKFEVGNRTGVRRNTIQVRTDDPLAPVTALIYEVTIPSLITISPRLVHWRVGAGAEKRIVRVEIDPEADLKVTGAKLDNESFDAVVVEGEKPNEYRIELTPLKTNLPSRAIISLQTEPEVENRHNFSFYAYVR